jgi:hypothetical protein
MYLRRSTSPVPQRSHRSKGMHKLSAPWEGSFIVMEVVSPPTYRLQWADGQGVPNVWNIEHLRRCRAYSPGTHTRKDEDGFLLEFSCNPTRTCTV